jgi:hypothetical protein
LELTCNVCKHAPESEDQMAAAPLVEAVTTVWLSGENCTDVVMEPVPTGRVQEHSPETALQTLAVPSLEAVATA